MSQKRFDLYVPISDDGRTTFSEVSDILEHLATLYAWHPDVYGFFVTRAHEARQIDTVYEKETGDIFFKSLSDHVRDNPNGCGVVECDVCHVR